MATWMQTHTGHAFDYKDVFAIEDFNLLDIAQALAHQPRYNGHFGAYSVAQHSVLLADYAFRKMSSSNQRADQCARTALFHDASEAYVGDMVSPLKARFPLFSEIEDQILRAIMEKFDGLFPLPPWLKTMDVAILVNEKRDLIDRVADEPRSWNLPYPALDITPIMIWPAERAKAEFLERHARYS